MKTIRQLTDGLDDGAVNRFRLNENQRLALPLNDKGNAARILHCYGDDLWFVAERGWFVWSGFYYEFWPDGLAAAQIAACLPDLIEAEIRLLDKCDWSDDKKDARKKALKRYAIECGNLRIFAAALKVCEHQVRAKISDLDNDPRTLVVQNGHVDLNKVLDAVHLNAPSRPSPEELAVWREPWLIDQPSKAAKPSKIAGVIFDPVAACDNWENFIELVLPDKEIRECFQRVCGQLLVGNPAQIVMFLRGSGANGKSTILSVLGEVLGTYVAHCKVEMFLVNKNSDAGRASPEEMSLPGARAAIASEPGVTDEFSASKIKALTGGDVRPIRGLHKEQFEYLPNFTPIIAFNRMPRIKDGDYGTFRRIVLFPFEIDLRGLKLDQRKTEAQIKKELSGETSGILNWMLDGLRDFQARLDAGKGTPPGIDPPKSMRRIVAQLRSGSDPVGTFLTDCTIKPPKKYETIHPKEKSNWRVRTTDLVNAFQAHSRECFAPEMTGRALIATLLDLGFEKGRGRDGRMYIRGLRFRNEQEDQFGFITKYKKEGL